MITCVMREVNKIITTFGNTNFVKLSQTSENCRKYLNCKKHEYQANLWGKELSNFWECYLELISWLFSLILFLFN